MTIRRHSWLAALWDTHTHTHVQSYPCGVRSLRVVLQDSGQAEVGHFRHEVTVHQDVTSCQVPVDVAHVGQVPEFTKTQSRRWSNTTLMMCVSLIHCVFAWWWLVHLMPDAMPRSIPTNWITVNWPSFFWWEEVEEKKRSESNVNILNTLNRSSGGAAARDSKGETISHNQIRII